MKAGTRYNLQGAFRCQLLSGNKVVSDTDWFSNFITPTGLTYPLTYPFVDCFQFLSLGNNGSVLNYGADLGSPTTGLASPIVTFNTTAGTQSGQYLGWPGYESDGSSCGTVLTETGPRFFRAWLIPTGQNVYVNEPAGYLNIQELMVSPGSGSDPIGASAFSRITRSLTIPNGYQAIISYQLSINLENTGRTMFSGGTFTTGNADVSQDYGIISQWANLSGYYRQVYFGLDCIDEMGAHYMPSQYGEGMEPYVSDFTPYTFYLSPDNAAFDISISGGLQSNVSLSYQADGLMEYLDGNNGISLTPVGRTQAGQSVSALNNIYYGPVNQEANILSNQVTTWPNTPYNIRIGGSANLITPLLGSYQLDSSSNVLSGNFQYQTSQQSVSQPISFATPGASGFESSVVNLGQKAVFSSKIYKLPFVQSGQNAITGRTKTVTRKTLFSPIQSMGYNSRFGSMVYAFNLTQSPTPPNSYYPYVDCIFFDTSGRSMMQHYRFISGAVLTERGSGICNAYANIVNANNTQGTNGNMQVFTNRQTYQGEYNSAYVGGIDTSSANPVLTAENAISSRYSTFGNACLFSGNLNPNSTGSTLFNIANGSGVGSVYGIVMNNLIGGGVSSLVGIPFDLGLADHSLNTLHTPGYTGAIYWPTIASGNQLYLTFSGVKFFYPSVGVIADTGWFDSRHQIIADITFTDMQPGCTINPTGWANLGSQSNWISNPTGFQTLLSNLPYNPVGGVNYGWGYYLSTVQYNYQDLGTADIGNFVCHNSSNFAVTGFIDTGSWASCNIAPSMPATYLSATVRTGNVSAVSAGNFVAYNAVIVTGFFTGLYDRGYTTGINGVPITGNQNLEFFVSGYSGTSPLYLTYIGYDKGNNYAIAHSYLSPTVSTTMFCRPSGVIYSDDVIQTATGAVGYRLLPSYGIANNTNTNTYTAETGGALPALSFDNGLELYLNLSWNSPCAGAQNCTDDPFWPND